MHLNRHKICPSCEQPFWARWDAVRKKHITFCSRECVNVWQRRNKVRVVCPECGKERWCRQSKVRRYCSMACYQSRRDREHQERIVQGHVFASSRSVRGGAMKDNCQLCGYNKCPGILQLHHLDQNKKNNVPENMLCVCPTCHMEIHFYDKTGPYREGR
jgi:hypothetical protein